MTTSHTNTNDLYLAQQLHQGKQQVVGLLFDRYAGALTGLISNLVPDEATAEKVISTTFLKAWTMTADFDPNKQSLFTWLARLARETASEIVISKSGTQTYSNLVSTPAAASPTGGQAAGSEISKHTCKNLKLLEMVYLHGLTCQQAAQRLHATPEVLKADLRLAINQLREVTAE